MHTRCHCQRESSFTASESECLCAVVVETGGSVVLIVLLNAGDYLLQDMNIIIAGGGVAGLSAAAVLRKLSFVKSILIFEPAALTALTSTVNGNSNSSSSSIHHYNSHHYNGIWSPALQCLDSIGVLEKTKNQFHAVRTSGYKDFAGRWLAQPTVGLQEPPSKIF